MSQTAYKQGMLAWDWPTNYVIIIIWCVPRKNRVMPSFGMTITRGPRNGADSKCLPKY